MEDLLRLVYFSAAHDLVILWLCIMYIFRDKWFWESQNDVLCGPNLDNCCSGTGESLVRLLTAPIYTSFYIH